MYITDYHEKRRRWLSNPVTFFGLGHSYIRTIRCYNEDIRSNMIIVKFPYELQATTIITCNHMCLIWRAALLRKFYDQLWNGELQWKAEIQVSHYWMCLLLLQIICSLDKCRYPWSERNEGNLKCTGKNNTVRVLLFLFFLMFGHCSCLLLSRTMHNILWCA